MLQKNRVREKEVEDMGYYGNDLNNPDLSGVEEGHQRMDGYAEDIKNYVIEYFNTPETRRLLKESILNDKELIADVKAKAISESKPYLPTAIAAGLLMGFIGAWGYSWWSNRKGGKKWATE